MKTRLLQGTAAALILSCSAQMALADLSPQDVWSDWKDYMTSHGYELDATETLFNNTLTIGDPSLTMELPDDQGKLTVSFGTLVFRDNGDGSVSLDMPETMPLHIQTTGGEDEMDAQLKLTQLGASVVFTGSPEEITQNYRSAEMVVAYSSLSVNNEPLPADALRAAVAGKQIISTSRMTKADESRSYVQSGSMEELSADFFFSDPDTPDEGLYTLALKNLTFEGQTTVPDALAVADFTQMLEQGFDYNARFTFDSGSSRLNGKAEGQDFTMTSTSAGGSFASGMSKGALSYDVLQNDSEIVVQTSDLPFPISLASDKMGFKLNVPLVKSENEQPFAFGLTLVGFTMPEELWGIFDPGQILPRDPATAILDLDGKARVLANIFDPKFEESPETPAELTALTINDLQLSAAGTSLTAKGSFTFDNSDVTTFDGLPAPDGTADLQLTGGNGLIDKLIQMGFISDQDAMGARMMMGMLGTPGEDDDTLTSHIEVKPSGQIFANGQRLK